MATKRGCGCAQVGLRGNRVAELGSKLLRLLVLAISTAAALLWFAVLPDEHLALAILPPVLLKLLHGWLLLGLLEVYPLQGLG